MPWTQILMHKELVDHIAGLVEDPFSQLSLGLCSIFLTMYSSASNFETNKTAMSSSKAGIISWQQYWKPFLFFLFPPYPTLYNPGMTNFSFFDTWLQ